MVQPENLPGPPIQGSDGGFVRHRCDARGFTPLPIEIIARQKVAPAFEPQKVSSRTAPLDKTPCRRGGPYVFNAIRRSQPAQTAVIALVWRTGSNRLTAVFRSRLLFALRKRDNQSPFTRATSFCSRS